MTAGIVIAALVAGALGALARFGVARAFRASPARLPWAVLLVNIAGCLLAGIAVSLSFGDPHGTLRMIAVSGFAGGLTTFSTFSVETVQLAIDGRWRAATRSVLGNVLGGLAAFALAWGVTQVVVFGTTFWLTSG